RALYVLPGGGWFRGPDRGLVVLGLSAALLAGAALDVALASPTRRTRGGLAVAAVLAGAVAVVAATAWSRLPPAGARLVLAYLGAALVALLLGARVRGRGVAQAAAGVVFAIVIADLVHVHRAPGPLPSQLRAYLGRNEEY